MSTLITRRIFCAGGLLPPATLWLPACGGSDDDTPPATDAPARWADVAIRANALAPPPGLPPHYSARILSMAFSRRTMRSTASSRPMPPT